MKNILDKSRLQAEHRRRSFGGRRLGRAWLTAWIVVAAALIGRSLWSTGSEPKRLASATPLSGASWTEPSRSAEDVPSASRYKFRAIEELRVGDRVVSDNPDVDSPVETAIDPNTWRRLRLYAEERWPDGTLDTIHVDTLQSPEWIEQWQAQVGAEVPPPVDLVEMGLPEDLVTKVVANEPCPPLSPPLPGDDPGRLVLTTVDHLNNDVWELAAEPVRGPPADAAPAAASQRETLRPTGLHKFYSETRRDWVSTKDLHDNEVIRGRAEPLRIVARCSLPGVQRVYNLTVEGEHVYYVSKLGLLAHNTCDVVYRHISAADRARLDAGQSLVPKGRDGSIADHVAGGDTRYISASPDVSKIGDFDHGHGLIAINIKRAMASGAGYVDHKNVLQYLRRKALPRVYQNAVNAEEVLFRAVVH
jgi:hypothetical protein